MRLSSAPLILRLLRGGAVVLLFSTLFATVPVADAQVLARPEPDDALTVMSFNIASHHGCTSADGCLYDDGDFALDVVAQLIVDNGVDIAGLQEIERFTNRHNGVDMLAVLQQKLAALGYPMFAWFEARNPAPADVTQGEWGIALLSRVPARTAQFSQIYDASWHASSIHASAAPVQEAVFDIDGTLVRVFNTHSFVQGSCDVIDPGMVSPVQDHLDEFTVLMGDFNDPLTSPCMSTLLQTHDSVCVDSGDPSCAQGVDPDMHPNSLNVDHVLYRFGSNSPTAFLDGWVDQSVNDAADALPGPNWVSDHYPIFGRFDLDTPAATSVIAARPEPHGAVTVMSFNVAAQHWCQQPIGCLYDDPNYALDVVAQLIVDNGVDVVGLQEVDRFTNRHHGVDMVELLQDKLAALGYPMSFVGFEPWTPSPADVVTGEFGIAMLSRLPQLSYTATNYDWTLHDGHVRPVQEAVFSIADATMRVFHTHAPTGTVGNPCDVISPGITDQIPDHLDEFTVLIGDFNKRLNSACMQPLLATHTSACTASIAQTCVKGVDPNMHPSGTNIDHVLYRFGSNDSFEALDGWVDANVNNAIAAPYPAGYPGPYWVSNHYPIFGRFDVTPVVEPPSFVRGDVNCDQVADVVDALLIAQFDTQSRTGERVCPLPEPRFQLFEPAADFNLDNRVNIIDALLIAVCSTGVQNEVCDL